MVDQFDVVLVEVGEHCIFFSFDERHCIFVSKSWVPILLDLRSECIRIRCKHGICDDFVSIFVFEPLVDASLGRDRSNEDESASVLNVQVWNGIANSNKLADGEQGFGRFARIPC